MTPAARERRRVRIPLLCASAAAWLVLAAQSGGMALPAFCSPAAMWMVPPASSIELVLTLNPPASLAGGWALMLAAMMTPLLIPAIRHIRDRSFARRRARAIALFIAGYAAIWMAAGLVLLTGALAVRLSAPGSAAPLLLGALAALSWQSSPAKQICLNRCRAHPDLAAFGSEADRDSLRFGLLHGTWCAGACWALMLLPLLVASGHLAAMGAVAVWLLAERLDRAGEARWQWRWPGKAARMAVAQIRFRARCAEGAIR